MNLARWPWLALGLSALAVAVHLVPGGAESLELRPAALAAGEPWRLLTGHLAHWSLDHLLWDVLTFAALGALCERRSRRDLAWVVVLGSAAISISVPALHPGLPAYRGLSGLDVALYALLAGRLGGRSGAALGLLLAAKLGYEIATGSALFVASPPDAVVLVPEAHLAGALAAALYLGAAWIRRAPGAPARDGPLVAPRCAGVRCSG